MKLRTYKKSHAVALTGLLLTGSCLGASFEDAEAALARGDLADAVTVLSTLASGGNVRARTRLAGLYQKGEGVPRDLLRAISLYTEAAAQGDADAQFNLGNLYLLGEGVPQDDDWAFTYYRQAAAQGHPLARKNAMEFYRAAGISPPSDLAGPAPAAALAVPSNLPAPTQAGAAADTDQDSEHTEALVGTVPAEMTADEFQALEIARAGGIVVENLPGVAAAGPPTPMPPASSVTPPAAEDRLAPAALAAIKRRLAAGETAAARRDLELLADAGDAEAQYVLASVLSTLKASPNAAGESALWLRRAAEAGHAEAQFNLAQAYRRGDLLPVDELEAVSWYRAAARQGHEEARQQLAAIYRQAGIPIPADAFGPDYGAGPR